MRAGADRFVDPQHLLDRYIPYRVRGNAPAGVVRFACELEQLVIGKAKHTACITVPVGDAERRRGTAHPTVSEKLDRIDSEEVRYHHLGERYDPDTFHLPQGHHVDSARQRVLGIHATIDLEQRRRDARVVRAGDT